MLDSLTKISVRKDQHWGRFCFDNSKTMKTVQYRSLTIFSLQWFGFSFPLWHSSERSDADSECKNIGYNSLNNKASALYSIWVNDQSIKTRECVLTHRERHSLTFLHRSAFVPWAASLPSILYNYWRHRNTLIHGKIYYYETGELLVLLIIYHFNHIKKIMIIFAFELSTNWSFFSFCINK